MCVGLEANALEVAAQVALDYAEFLLPRGEKRNYEEIGSDNDGDDDVVAVPLQPELDRWVRYASRYGLSAASMQALIASGCPPSFLNILWAMRNNANLSDDNDLHFMDFFGGQSRALHMEAC